MTSRRETRTILFPKSSAQALTVVNPTRRPVKEPGPPATANRSTSERAGPALLRQRSTAGRSHEEKSSVDSWRCSAIIDPPWRRATLPLESQVSIPKTTNRVSTFPIRSYCHIAKELHCIAEKVRAAEQFQCQIGPTNSLSP